MNARTAMLKQISVWREKTPWPLVARAFFYMSASVLARISGLILLPILIVTLTAEEFSRYGLYTSTINLALPLLTLNVFLAPSRLFFDYHKFSEQARLLYTTLLGALVFSILTVGPVFVLVRGLRVEDPISLGRLEFQLYILLAFFAMLMVRFGQTLIRIKGHARLYMITSLLQSGGLILLYSGLTALDDTHAYRDVLLASLVSVVVVAVICWFYVYPYIKSGYFDRAMLIESIRFAGPTSAHQIALWALNFSGRWIGLLYISLTDLAPYMLITQIFAAVGILARALFEALVPEIGTAFSQNDYRRGTRIIQLATAAAVAGVILVYGALLVVLYVFKLDVPLDYKPTLLMILIAAASNIFDALYLQGIQILQAIKKTHVQAISTLVAGTATIAVSFLLGYLYHENGLMLALALGWAVQSVLSNALARSYLKKQRGLTDATSR